MSISKGDTLPEATLIKMGDDGPVEVTTKDLTTGRKVVIFGVPGAYTPTCSVSHVPSFMRTKSQFMDKGVDEIVCVSVNDPFVMKAWGESTGASEEGLTMLADPASELTKAMGLDFDAPPVGLHARSKRFAMIVDNGTVSAINVEASPGECEISAGEALLQEL
ncbi:MAG: peroxiredoxin [Pseudomonadota bacterium]